MSGMFFETHCTFESNVLEAQHSRPRPEDLEAKAVVKAGRSRGHGQQMLSLELSCRTTTVLEDIIPDLIKGHTVRTDSDKRN